MVQVTHVRLQCNRSGHEHVIEVRWYSPADGQMGSSGSCRHGELHQGEETGIRLRRP